MFNALNTLSVLAAEARADRVVDVIGRLASLLRAALEQPDGTTTLEQEVRFLGRYLDFERVRFEDRLEVEWDISGECLQAAVPALVLQPLVENAIKHGVDRTTGSVSLVIGATRSGGRIRLWVSDHGPGLQQRTAERDGIGLRNTRDRLQQLFGDRCALNVESANGRGVTATIMIPWMKTTDRNLQEATT
jgi:sensor histidine kinase YesM